MSRLDDVIDEVAYIQNTLMAYKRIIQHGNCNSCRNKECQWKPEWGEGVRYNCPFYKRTGAEE